MINRFRAAMARLPRATLATLPTPLEDGGVLPGGAHLWVKRDDLTGLGMGGNKARKLELLCGSALAAGADTLVTVGAAQSNHCRMTAAAGAVLGLRVHLVLGGERPSEPTGNQLLSRLFGAITHHAGTDQWPELEEASRVVADGVRAHGGHPYLMPIGGSTDIGALGFALAFEELMGQCEQRGIGPGAIVHATSSGGTHAGLLAGRAVHRAAGRAVPTIAAIGVAKGVVLDATSTAALARAALAVIELAPALPDHDAVIDPRWLGPDYAVPTAEADAATVWAARRGAWVLDRVYTAKAFAGMLGRAAEGEWGPGDEVVFWHTGGQPAVFAPGGLAADATNG